MLGFIAICGERILSDCDFRLQKDRRRAGLLLGALALGYICLWGGLTSLRHYYFHSGGDLANQHQVVWNSSQGRFFARSMEVSNDLADHVRPYLLLLSPIYLFFPSPYVLLVFQALVLALGVVPLFLLAKRKLGSPSAALAIAICFLAYPPLGFINRFDFHAEVIAIPLLLSAYERIDAGDWKKAAVFMVLALLGKESIGVSVAALGITVAIFNGDRRFGLTWGWIGFSYSLAALFWIIPSFRGAPADTLARYSWLGNGPYEILTNVILHPNLLLEKILTTANLVTLLQLIAPLACLPLLSLSALLPVLPVLVYNFASDFAPQRTIYYQYMAPAIPFLFIGAVHGLQQLGRLISGFARSEAAWPSKRMARAAFGFGIMLMLLATGVAWVYENPVTTRSPALPDKNAPAGTLIEKKLRPRPSSPGILPNDAAVREGLRQTPPEGMLLTTTHYLPHLSHRRYIGKIPRVSKSTDISRVETILLNLKDVRHRSCEDYLYTLREAVLAGFGITFHRDGVILLQKYAGDSRRLHTLLADWPGCV